MPRRKELPDAWVQLADGGGDVHGASNDEQEGQPSYQHDLHSQGMSFVNLIHYIAAQHVQQCVL